MANHLALTNRGLSAVSLAFVPFVSAGAVDDAAERETSSPAIKENQEPDRGIVCPGPLLYLLSIVEPVCGHIRERSRRLPAPFCIFAIVQWHKDSVDSVDTISDNI